MFESGRIAVGGSHISRLTAVIGGLLWLMVSVCPTLADEPTAARLAVEGEARLPVVVGPDASEQVRAAASELADQLGRITGGTFEVQTGAGDAGIVVGVAGDFTALPFDVAFEDSHFHREDYALRSSDAGLWLIGATDQAVDRAVWDVLYRLGHRQYFPGDTWEIVPREPNAQLAVHADESPDFIARRIWYNWGMRWGYNQQPYREWSQRNRVVRGFMLNSGHSYGRIIRANEDAFEAHPEYRALVDGERRGNKFCISNEGLRQLVVDWAVRRIENEPDRDSISLDPSDGGGWCECEPCAEMGSVSDRVVILANAVAEAINDLDHGDKYVGIYAYNEHAPPPSVQVHPHVIVSVATAFIRGGYTFDQIIEGWSEKAKTLGIYDYFSVVAWDYNMPRAAKAARPHKLAASIRDLHQRGVRFWDAESGDAWGPYGLGYYVAGRVFWDVREAERVDALIDEFLADCFGPAREPMEAFYHLLCVDEQRRSNVDMVARMYRLLAEARELAGDDEDVRRRIDDLILYTRYVELRGSQTEGRGADKGDVLKHVYRMRERMMVHSYGLWARLANQQAAHDPEHEHKDDRPFTEQDIQRFLDEGIARYEPVEIDFEPVEYSDTLVPAADRLDLSEVEPGRFPRVPQGRHTYYIWIDEAAAKLTLDVQVQRVWNKRTHLIELYSPKQVDVEAVDRVERSDPFGDEPKQVTLETPYAGLHRVEVRDGGDYTRINWPAPVRVTLPADGPSATHMYRNWWTMYFYVPKGTEQVAGWARRIANWAPRVQGVMKDGDGNVVHDFSEAGAGWFIVPVPEGQDGRLWKFERNSGTRELMTVPPYLAPSAADLLLPEEVVNADATNPPNP
ncbi:MAG: DUF4838 domain-containing protein [Phycisphaeraceae bacterium]